VRAINPATPDAARAAPGDAFERIDQPVAVWARLTPKAPAVCQGGTALSYAEFAEAIARVAACLTDRGVRPGDRVLVVQENGLAAVTVLLAAARINAWAVPLNARLAWPEIEAIRRHARPRITVYTLGVSPDAEAHAERDGAAGAPGLEDLGMALRVAQAEVEADPLSGPMRDRVAVLLYTSGTTGRPKGVMLTNGNVLFIAERTCRIRRLTAGDRVYCVLPTSHIFGLAAVFLGSLCGGVRIDLVARFAPEETARALAEDGVTVFSGVPAIYAQLLSLAATRGAPLAAPSLRYMSVGGAPLDLALKREVEAMFGIPLCNGYGLTETSPTVSTTAIDDPRDDDSAGTLLEDVEVRILGKHGTALPAGEVGELWVRGGLVMKGYYRDSKRTAEVLTPEGWLKTGDLARLSADGNLYILGRLKELIIRSGFNVYPAEVEGAIADHPEVALVAVVGRQKDGNEEVVAFVQPRSGAIPDPEDLAAFAAARLAPYKRPAAFLIRDHLPVTAAGKILKHSLKQELDAAVGIMDPGGRG
jgi:acyl-CoA synthetase (AMP-forming)/AMP-acid ligase II